MEGPFSAARTPGAARQNTGYADGDAAKARFQLQAVLGKGAYGTVYRALDTSNGEIVAIKVIPVTEQDKEEFKQIQKEIAFLSDCNHPNVVRYLGSYRQPTELWIVMEYCGGGSVADLISAGREPLAEELIAYICCEALKGLAYLHSLGKVHRDIKCGNILLTGSGEVKIADFGVSAQLTNTLSKRQTFIGTPHWMAPEVIQESRYDGKVDVWALGISAIEMAETTPPRWAVHPLRVIFMISRDPPPRLAAPERWSHLFADFVAQALIKDPKQRPTARYLLQHRFVVTAAQRPQAVAQGAAAGAGGAAGPGGAPGGGAVPVAGLMPRIAQAQRYLQDAADAAPAPTPEPELKELAGLATGRFSWRGGTVRAAAQGAGAHAPADAAAFDATLPAGAGAALGGGSAAQGGEEAGRGGRGGRGPSALPSPAPPSGALPSTPAPGSAARRVSSSAGFDSTVLVKESYSGTMVVHEGYDTVVAHDRGGGSNGVGGGAGGGSPPGAARSPATPAAAAAAEYASTMVVVSGGGGVAVAEAATVRRAPEVTAGDGAGGGYMAAVRAAAAEGAQRDRHVRSSDSPSAAAPAPAAVSEVERVRERLHAVYDGGLVIPLPFMRAEQAQPLALLGGWGGAGAGAAGSAPEAGAGGDTATGVHAPADTCGVDPEAYGVVLELVRASAAMALQRGEPGLGPGPGGEPAAAMSALPPTVLTQLLFHPGLQNLARTLAYNRRCAAMLPLDRAAQAELADSCHVLAAALQCALSL